MANLAMKPKRVAIDPSTEVEKEQRKGVIADAPATRPKAIANRSSNP